MKEQVTENRTRFFYVNMVDEMGRQRIKTADLARMTGIAYTTLYDIVKGKTSIDTVSVDKVIKIAHALGATVDDLMEEGFEVDSMTADERDMLDAYRLLDEGQRGLVLSMARQLGRKG